MVVVDQVRIPLVRLAAHKAVEALKTTAQRPLFLRRREVHLILGGQVPFPNRVRIPTTLDEHLRDVRAFTRDVAIGVGEPVGDLRDPRHPVRRVVAPRHQTRPCRRAQRRGMKVRVLEPALGDPVNVWRLDQPAVRFQRREPDIIEHDVHHVRRALRRRLLDERLPVRDRLLDIDVDRALKRLSHLDSSGPLPVPSSGPQRSGAPPLNPRRRPSTSPRRGEHGTLPPLSRAAEQSAGLIGLKEG